MSFRLAADALLLLHFVFIAFVVLGALLVWRWPKLVWLHLPAAAWGAYVELAGRICPLTPLENQLRQAAGDAGYTDSFVEHYLLGVIYPEGLTRELQLAMGAGVLAINLLIYGAMAYRRASKR